MPPASGDASTPQASSRRQRPAVAKEKQDSQAAQDSQAPAKPAGPAGASAQSEARRLQKRSRSQSMMQGATTGLPYFMGHSSNLAFTASSVAMKRLHDRIEGYGKRHLLELIKGWTGNRTESSGNIQFLVPGEGVLRSADRAIDYLDEVWALANPEKEPPGALNTALQEHCLADQSCNLVLGQGDPPCQTTLFVRCPSHAWAVADTGSKPLRVRERFCAFQLRKGLLRGTQAGNPSDIDGGS